MLKRLSLVTLFSSLIIFLGSACNSDATSKPSSENVVQIEITETFTPALTATSIPTSTPTTSPSSTPSPASTTTPTLTPVPTSTFTPTSTVLPTETPDLEKFGFETYTHPSGKFKLDMASRDTQMIEFDDAVFFTDGFHLIMAGFTEQEYPLNTTDWITSTQLFLDQFLVEWSLVTSYDSLERLESEDENTYTIQFNYVAKDAPVQEGLGQILLLENEDNLYGLVLLTPEYHDVEFVWGIVKNSFTPLEVN